MNWRTLPQPTVEAVGFGNLLSTVAGLPLAWLASLAGLGLLESSHQASGLLGEVATYSVVIPNDRAPQRWHWTWPAGTLLFALFAFFASWWLEYWLAKRRLREVPRASLRRAVGVANVASYGLLALLVLAQLLWALRTPTP